MQLLVEPNYQGKKEGSGTETQFTDPNVQIDTATLLNVMQSYRILQLAVDKLKPEYPDITVGGLKQSLVLTQIRTKEDGVSTKIFQVDYTDKDPSKTRRVLDAIRQVYLSDNTQQQSERI